MTRRTWTDSKLEESVSSSTSYAEVMRKLGIRPVGGNYKTVKRRIAELSLDCSHMIGISSNIGRRFESRKKKIEELLVLGINSYG